jgi:hypothetical protein
MHGRCLCGEVRFEVEEAATPIGMCHCSKCRRVSGVASNAEFMAGREKLRWLAGAVRQREPGPLISPVRGRRL